MSLDDLPFDYPDAQGPTLAGAVTERKCRRHRWDFDDADTMCLNCVTPWKCNGPHLTDQTPYARGVRHCSRCGAVKDETRSRRGRQSRNYGNRAELKASRLYGGTKIGQAGGPTDIRGKDWNTQVKTHRRLPPREWTKAFAALEASGERLPRLLLRFVQGPGLPPIDFFVVPGKAWLDWFGRDDDGAAT